MSSLSEVRFGTRYGARSRVFSNAGCDLEPKYSPKFLDDGSLDLEIVGQVNIFEDIQSHRDECDIHNILRRFASGETDVLQRVQGFFGDFSSMPSTYPEMFNLLSRSEEFFKSLPVETKSLFHNSFQEFLTASQSPSFLSLFVSKATSSTKSPEESSNESKTS